MIETPTNSPVQHQRIHSFSLAFVGILLLSGLVLWYVFSLSQAPRTTPLPLTLEIEKGMTVRAISNLAEERGVVRSELFLYSIMTAFYDPTTIHAGRYVFSEPMSVFDVAEKIATNAVDENLITLTIPEGVSAARIASIASNTLPAFVSEEYLSLAKPEEGYLFPETYFVPEDFTAQSLYELQQQTYADITAELQPEFASSTLTEYEVITLASIVEREANDEESMKMVSGILQNRLRIGMPLQADATVEYVLETPLNELAPGELAENLRELDSPYNTYQYRGLPPTPIGNPGLTSIKAVLEPTPSNYLFYITGDDGNFYYAETLDEHNENVDRYLR